MKPAKEAAVVAQAPSVKTTNVKLAFLHQALTWPGVAGAEKTLSDAKIKGVKMTLLPQGLLLELKGKLGDMKQCLIPHTNVVNYVLED